jgi:BirA family transcriptional regulator, biotin operon repressor / biotin---[acetyl-CoA-carboxylase] ligase
MANIYCVQTFGNTTASNTMGPRRAGLDGTVLNEAGTDAGALDEAGLRRAVLTPSSIWSALDVVAQTGSTNEDLLAAARAGTAEGAVLVAEDQTRGRGRQGRTWASVPGAALTFSVLLRPVAVPPADQGWLPLLTGVALIRALRAITGVEAFLKWPNDVLVDGAKLAGILAEQAGDAIVVGVGVNVATAPDGLLAARAGALAATSLASHGVSTDRRALLVGVLRELEHWYRRWTAPAAGLGTAPGDAPGTAPGDAEGSGLRAEYLRWCSTIGRDLRVQLPGDAQLAGVASGIDRAGRLVVQTATGAVPVSAGDVVHVR